MLPFGLRSAPKIFSAVADAFAWHLHQIGIPYVDHYLDDYIVLGPPLSPLCQQYLHQLQTECSLLGIPLAAHKTEGPTTCLTFLGIEIDSVAARTSHPPTSRMGYQEVMLTKRTRISDRPPQPCMQGHQARTVFPSPYARPATHYVPPPTGGSPNPLEQRLPIGPSMVVNLHRGLERHLPPRHPISHAPRHDDVIRVRVMGLRSMVSPFLVPNHLGLSILCADDCREGIPPHHSGLCHLGKIMAWPPSHMPLRQPGGGSQSSLQNQQVRRNHASSALSDLRGGALSYAH